MLFRRSISAVATGFEPAISSLTGMRVKPGYTTRPAMQNCAMIIADKDSLVNKIKQSRSIFISMTNKEVAELLQQMTAAYEILGESRFRINAYAQAADSIANLQQDVNEYWKSGRLQEIPGVGGSIAQHLDELLQKGSSGHFDDILKKMPVGMFAFLKLRGVGPKTAFRLANVIAEPRYRGKNPYERLANALQEHAVQELEGFGEKKEQDIGESLKQYRQGATKKKRMLLSEAMRTAESVIAYLLKDTSVTKAEALGSLRRKKPTIGDVDIAVATSDEEATIQHFVSHPGCRTVIDKGEKGATILLPDDIQVDMRVVSEDKWGSMLQYFTGSKYHNIRLREYALAKGYSLSEYGIKDANGEGRRANGRKERTFSSEEKFYQFLDLQWIPPEMREDRGEIELAEKNKLPTLISPKDILGDLHIHSNYAFPTSHDLGVSPVESLISAAREREYQYIALTDHNPKSHAMSQEQIITIIKERKNYIEHFNSRNKSIQKNQIKIKVFNMLETDIRPNGEIALPLEALNYLQAILVSIHSSFEMDTEAMTKRILKALSYPKVRIFAHPTGRQINQRDGVKANWEVIFRECKKREIALELNATPQRLDLPDDLIMVAKRIGCRFTIGTDSHHVDHMSFMPYGVYLARRGWLTKSDILNTLPAEKFEKWLLKKTN